MKDYETNVEGSAYVSAYDRDRVEWGEFMKKLPEEVRKTFCEKFIGRWATLRDSYAVLKPKVLNISVSGNGDLMNYYFICRFGYSYHAEFRSIPIYEITLTKTDEYGNARRFISWCSIIYDFSLRKFKVSGKTEF